MQEAITTRFSKDILSEIERFAQFDQADRSAEIRKLLEIGIYERKKKEVIERYRSNKISTENAAEELGITLWEVLELFRKEKVEAQYDEEDFLRDIEAMS